MIATNPSVMSWRSILLAGLRQFARENPSLADHCVSVAAWIVDAPSVDVAGRYFDWLLELRGGTQPSAERR